MSKPFIWSISKFRDFEQCPRMCRKKHVEKAWQELPNEAMERGKRVHKAMEDTIKYDLELPPELAHMDPIARRFMAMRPKGTKVFPEFKFGVDMDFKRVEFFDGENLRVRCVLDLFIQDEAPAGEEFGKILIVDWKTGKYKDEHREDAEFYGAMTHLAFAGMYRTSSMYCYADDLPRTFVKPIEEAWLIAANWWKKFEYADKLILSAEAPATPCNACAWCGDATCKFNKNKKLGKG